MDILKIIFCLFVVFFAISCSLIYSSNPEYHVSFDSDIAITPLNGYNYLTYTSITAHINDYSITVPKGFETDLASIPRVFWPITSPMYSGFVAPSILHDYLYRSNSGVTRRYADDILYYSLLSEGVSKYTATKFWLATRIFGINRFMGN